MIKSLIYPLYRKLHPIKIRGYNNKVNIGKVNKRHFRITISGNNNSILIKDNCRLFNLNICISGDGNTLILDEYASFLGKSTINLMGKSKLQIGEKTGIRGVQIYGKDADISIGENCMLSYDIILRNNDMHTIFDIKSSEIINRPKDINISKHVWIAPHTTILKGVTIGENSIIATGSICTKNCPTNSIMAGVPAKIVKTGIKWSF